MRRRNHADADREIRDWALAVERDWGVEGPRAQDEPGDPFAFGRARYAERWPAAGLPARRGDRTAGNQAAIQAFVDRRQS